MRLSKIKLAGFKSFVDPTSLKLPGNLTGIVGPNGCGKSNVIDAVRWVMGESSAKHLRGSSMEDVIFNGSSGRKPVGMASVELLFDNADGTAPGPYAQYNEISVKRSVTRDGQSKYYLNNSHCRRRDIADLFLGTGLGPRSYAIIEQGMISRLIEAKPEEMRVYIEEAAGISKYKERRKETENRIRHTRDNLARLDDLLEEIDKQLARLKRQSRAAERYKELKAEERQYKAEQLALRWRELKLELDGRDQEIEQTDAHLEKLNTEQRTIESKIESQRQQHDEANDQLNKVQGRYYSLGADISGIEQNIKYQKDLQQRQQTDLEQVEAELRETTASLQNDRDTIAELEQKLAVDKPDLEQTGNTESEISQLYHQAEEAMHDWQQIWDDFNKQYSDTTQKAQIENSRIQQLERHIGQLQQRLKRIEHEREALSGENLDEKIAELQQRLRETEQEKAAHESKLAGVLAQIRETREQIVESEQQSAEQRRRIHEFQGRLSSLEALQQAALGKEDRPVNQWLERQGLTGKKRFAQQLEVEPGWERAVETVLGDTLEAVCVDDLDGLSRTLTELDKSNLSLVETASVSGHESVSASGLLREKIRSDLELNQFMHGIHIAADLDVALDMRTSLAQGESVITPDGVWVGRNWLRITRDQQAKQGVLAREHDIRDIKQQLEVLEQTVAELNQKQQGEREQLQAQEHKREQVQQALNLKHSEINDVQSRINAHQSRQEHVSKHGETLAAEYAEIEQQIGVENEEIEQATLKRNESVTLLEQLSERREQLSRQRDSLREQVQQYRQQLQQQREQLQALAVRIEGMNTRKQSLEFNIQRLTHNLETQQQRRDELKTILDQSGEPVERLQQELKALLEQRLESEKALAEARRTVEAINHELKELESDRGENEQFIQQVRGNLEQMKLDSQELRVRSKTAVEQLQETSHTPEQLLTNLDDQANSAEWTEKVTVIGQRISRLGPINLAAIDEYQQEQERKQYLDEQHADVSSALETLESAIAKIDKETRTRFKDTYDHVNSRLKQKFPRLFGGGAAYLELTGDDLLSTGVTVMARPPGKRITNIHLLSGGEKALTAVALVFSIFELNPAPFCILDEVDAPLDEANVGRFCQIVKDMSETVQFIYITHNKTTMELSEQLSGVTMREAGVSRLVSVDVAEAATMAAA
ncbi:MAG: chromosome segregation protein SMC [Gammaproteobacteria bacterium]|nr:chromosome segregation protein SMC [Gammaproteobacteria bacterium]